MEFFSFVSADQEGPYQTVELSQSLVSSEQSETLLIWGTGFHKQPISALASLCTL